MRSPSAHGLAATAFVMLASTMTVACAGRTGSVGSTAAGEVAGGEIEEVRWSGHIFPQSDPPLSGSVAIMQSSSENQMVVVVSLQGLPSAAGALGWRLEHGLCKSPGTIVGTPGDYSPVVLHADGTGESTATIAGSVPTDGLYSVRVFGLASPGSRLVACGDLARGDGSGS